MAKPISTVKKLEIPEETKHEQHLDEVTKAVSENKEAILKGIELVSSLHESGALDFANALVKRREDALENIITEINKEQYASLLENMSKLVLYIGELNVDELYYFTERINDGIHEAAVASEDSQTSYLDLLRALKDPQINRSITMLLNFLRGMGKE
ncbi:DUF1641 domain-containing protein [Oceanobacillus halotolerans]|uniref:DUF1641 domain-containing protein n=1 Tax=Oceanobacillus halotolerans TaxID=2663380 RepID=UPI0013DCDE0E|nr:DUF1641 domain-containing protein [Oceanobacillus halotolerans]